MKVDQNIKVGTTPKANIIFKYNYKLQINQRVEFRENYPRAKYQTAIVKEKDDNCIFLELF